MRRIYSKVGSRLGESGTNTAGGDADVFLLADVRAPGHEASVPFLPACCPLRCCGCVDAQKVVAWAGTRARPSTYLPSSPVPLTGPPSLFQASKRKVPFVPSFILLRVAANVIAPTSAFMQPLYLVGWVGHFFSCTWHQSCTYLTRRVEFTFRNLTAAKNSSRSESSIRSASTDVGDACSAMASLSVPDWLVCPQRFLNPMLTPQAHLGPSRGRLSWQICRSWF